MAWSSTSPSLCKPFAAACALAAALVGCRHVDNVQTDLMERELRQQEDYIYELEDYLMEYSEKLRQARMMCEAPAVVTEPAATSTGAAKRSGSSRRPLIEPELVDDPPRRTPPPARRRATEAPGGIEPATPEPELDSTSPPSASPATPPADDPEATEPLDLEDLEAPELEIGPTGDARPLPWQRQVAASAAPLLIPDPADYEQTGELASSETLDSAESLTLAPPANGDRHVPQQLEIRRLFGNPPIADADLPDQQSADTALSSLLTVVEVHGAAGEPLDAEGNVSLMVMQGQAPEALTRIHRWDFTPEETSTAWQSSPLGDGLHFELPLEGVELPPGPLELWARLVTADGRKLLTRVPFERDQLAALDDAGASPAATAALQPIPAFENEADYDEDAAEEDSVIAASTTTESEAASTAGQWRRATRHIGPRAEGFGSTSSPSTASGWTARSQTTTLR